MKTRPHGVTWLVHVSRGTKQKFTMGWYIPFDGIVLCHQGSKNLQLLDEYLHRGIKLYHEC